MHPALESIKSSVPKSLQTRLQTVKAPPSSFGEDGVDHINISLDGKTRLGQLLAFSSKVKIDHPYFGHFESMDGFWSYLTSSTRDERFRKLSGSAARKLSRESPKLKLTNLKYLLKDAEWMRINANKELVDLIKQNTLPYISYYNEGKNGNFVRQPVHHAGWYVPFINEVAFSIQFNIEPDSFRGCNKISHYRAAEEVAQKYYEEQRLIDAKLFSEALASVSNPVSEEADQVQDTCVGDGSVEALPPILESVEPNATEDSQVSDETTVEEPVVSQVPVFEAPKTPLEILHGLSNPVNLNPEPERKPSLADVYNAMFPDEGPQPGNVLVEVHEPSDEELDRDAERKLAESLLVKPPKKKKPGTR